LDELRGVSLYIRTLALFKEDRPGYGIDTGAEETAYDHPMAYALYASAEARRFLVTRDIFALENANRAANWLRNHGALAETGDIGWGLPYAWDAFSEGTINPPNTVYTITTALGIMALLDTYEACRVASTKEELSCEDFLDIAIQAARTFLNGHFDQISSDEIVFWYSSLEQDSYHVLNVSSMFAGQLQRLAQYISSPNERTVFEEFADRAIQYVLHRMIVDEQGNCYWHYFGDKKPHNVANRSNDLVHEAYTIFGITEYVAYGGRLAESVDLGLLLESLKLFLGVDDVIYEFPKCWDFGPGKAEVRYRPARLWGVGFALFVASYIEQLLGYDRRISSALFQGLLKYWTNGKWNLTPNRKSPIYPRQIAHVLLGLSAWFFPTSRIFGG